MKGRRSDFLLVLVAVLVLTAVAASPTFAAPFKIGASDAKKGLWFARFNSPEEGGDLAKALAVSPDGSMIVVTGDTEGGHGRADYTTIAYEAATGAERWVARFDGPIGDTDQAEDVAITSDGSTVIVTGTSYGKQGLTDFATLAYDAATGQKLWAAQYEGQESSIAHASTLALSPDGSIVVVTGSLTWPVYQAATVAYDVKTGTELWRSTYLGENEFAAGNDVVVAPDGSLAIVTGYTETDTGNEVLAAAYDLHTGVESWVSTYEGGSSGKFIAVSPDGTAVAIVGSRSVSFYPDIATIVLDPTTGVQRWVTVYDGSGRKTDRANDAVFDAAGSTIFVTGESNTGATLDMVTIAYDAISGGQLWLNTHEGPVAVDDSGEAVATSPTGRIVVITGVSTGEGGNADVTTIVYDASTGDTLRVMRAGRSNDDVGNDVAFGPDGRTIFVTGVVRDADFNGDYLTMAYGAVLPGH